MIAISWYDTVIFDLIRSGLSRTTFPSRGRLSLRRVLRIEFERAGYAAAPTVPRREGFPSKSPPFRLDNFPLAGYYIGCVGFGPKQRDSIAI